MFPRWQSSTLFAPSSIGARSFAPVRIASTKFSMWSASRIVADEFEAVARFGSMFSFTTLFFRS